MNAKELTQGQKEFIHDNHLEMSMMDMSKIIGVHVRYVCNYMQLEDILLDVSKIQRIKKMKRLDIPRNIIAYDANTPEVFLLTKLQQQFVIDNRFTMSSRVLAGELGVKPYHILKFMRAKSLMLSDVEVERLKAISRGKRPRKDEHAPVVRCMKPFPNNWMPKPWEHGVNLVTMARD